MLADKFRFIRGWKEDELLMSLRLQISEGRNGDWFKDLQLKTEDDLLFIDDFGASKKSEWTEEVLKSLLDWREFLDKPTIYTTNLDAKEMHATYGPRITDRFFSNEHTKIFVGGKSKRGGINFED